MTSPASRATEPVPGNAGDGDRRGRREAGTMLEPQAVKLLGKLAAPRFVNSRFSASLRARSVDRYKPASTTPGETPRYRIGDLIDLAATHGKTRKVAK
jgi:hypothetical protein